jgi:hypothetical protein
MHYTCPGTATYFFSLEGDDIYTRNRHHAKSFNGPKIYSDDEIEIHPQQESWKAGTKCCLLISPLFCQSAAAHYQGPLNPGASRRYRLMFVEQEVGNDCYAACAKS